ncbi:MAG: PKD domain-containing protein [Thermoplasmata archaeon]|nr:PKD domain-containing protein [Thermoplasmata archaeon]
MNEKSIPVIVLLAVLISAAPVSFFTEGSGYAPRSGESWTILVYMNGDSSLEDELIRDLNEMEKVGSSSDLDIIVQLDRKPGGDNSNGDWNGTRRYRVLQDDDPIVIASDLLDDTLGELDMNDPSTLEDFLTWGFTNYPADRYMVVMEGHARGPIDGFTGDDTSETSKSKMALEDFGSSFRSAVDSTISRPVDVISFDVCWMGMVEAAYEVMDHARYMIGSFDEIPANGARYELVIPAIVNSSMTLEESIVEVVEIYGEEYDLDAFNRWTLAGIDLQAFRGVFLPHFKELAKQLFYTAYDDSGTYRSIRAIIDMTPNNQNYRDIYHFLQVLSKWQGVDERVKESAEKAAAGLEAVVLHSLGGGVHSGDAIYFGIYLPGRGDFFDSRYEGLGSSEGTCWDDFVVRFTNSVHLEPHGLNWTDTTPGQIDLLLTSETPGNISSVRAEVIMGGDTFFVDLVSDGGRFQGARAVNGATVLEYRYIVNTIWGSTITFPPDGYSTIGFEGESIPPEVWHRERSVYDPFGPYGGLNFRVRDDTGVDISACALEYREEGRTSWYRIPLNVVDADPFTGWIRVRAYPTDIEPGGAFEYRLSTIDVLGNSGTHPADGVWSATFGAEESFYVDGYHSDLGGFDEMLGLWNSSGTNLKEMTGPVAGGVLDSYKCYLLFEPQRPFTEEEREELLDFSYQGGELLMIVDPGDINQAAVVRDLLEPLGISTTEEGEVNDLLLQNPSSDLVGDLPWISATFQGAIEVSGEGNAVYYTAGSQCAMVTTTYGKGRVVVSVPHLLDNSVMDREANRDLSQMVLFYLSRNIEPVVVYELDPDVDVIEVGQPLSITLGSSYDPDGKIVSYSMMVNDGSFSEGSDPIFVHTFHESGLYMITLKAIDSEGGESTAIVSIRADRPPTMQIGISSKEVHASEDVVFHYMGEDPDGDDISLLWDFGDGRIMAGGDIVSHKYDRGGVYHVVLTVTNSFGLSAVWEETVVVLNSDPVALIDRGAITVNRGAPSYTGPSRVTLMVHEGDEVYVSGALSSDSDKGDMLQFSWNVTDGISYQYIGPWVQHVFKAAGLWSINITVTDGHGGIGHSSINVNVLNDPPSGYFTHDRDGRKVTFFAEAIDDSWDMEGLFYIWEFDDGDKVETEGPTVEHTYTWGGTYSVKLTIMDGDGDRSTYSKDIDVEGLSLGGFIGIVLAMTIVIATLCVVLWFHMKRKDDAEDRRVDEELERRGRPAQGRGVQARPFRRVVKDDDPMVKAREFSPVRRAPKEGPAGASSPKD